MELLFVFGVIVFVLYVFSGKKRIPKVGQKFTCQSCGKTSTHTNRTVNAFRNGAKSAFCGNCHGQWAKNRTRGGGGCLASAITLMAIPVVLISYTVVEYVA